MTAGVPSKQYHRLRSAVGGPLSGLTVIGTQAQFYAKTLVSIKDAFVHYRTEMVRLIAQMSLSTGALALIGGTVAVVGFLTLSVGSLVGI
jgi:phospholipid/cholesterol/gamma-HCH transport system permease protein